MEKIKLDVKWLHKMRWFKLDFHFLIQNYSIKGHFTIELAFNKFKWYYNFFIKFKPFFNQIWSLFTKFHCRIFDRTVLIKVSKQFIYQLEISKRNISYIRYIAHRWVISLIIESLSYIWDTYLIFWIYTFKFLK